MKRIALLATIGLVTAACSDTLQPTSRAPVAATAATSNAPGTAQVTTANDAGPGSFRAAIQEANSNSAINTISFGPGLGVIALQTTVTYTGSQSLTVDGAAATLDASALASGSAFLANGGGDISIRDLSVQGAPDQGVSIQVPSGSSGLKSYRLVSFEARDNGGHGVEINDQTYPEEAGDPDASPPVPPNPAGSEASVLVIVERSVFHANGFGAIDRDGLRINEGADGDLTVVLRNVRASDNGADGIEFDERGAGDVRFDIARSELTGNGSFFEDDLDDGIDVDESGDGSLIGVVVATKANDNYEEGFDFNENDAGDFRVDMTQVEANRNQEEGIDFEEDDDFAGGGDLVTTLHAITANGNVGGDAGLKIREKGNGHLIADIAQVEAVGNETSGIQVREDGSGNLDAVIRAAKSDSNTNHGIDFDENGSGDVTAVVIGSHSTNNTNVGVRADNSGTGSGSLTLLGVTVTGNGAGGTGGNATVTSTP